MTDNPYLNYITSNHSLYDRYYRDWKLCIDSYHGGTEYKNSRYLRAYAVDTNTPGEIINTYETNENGAVINKIRTRIDNSVLDDNQSDVITGSFYEEKLDSTPLFNYVKLIVNEYNSMLFRNPPQRNLPNLTSVENFISDVDGEENSVNEFISQADILSTVFGVIHVECFKPRESDTPVWKIHSPLDITNWSYQYDLDGRLRLQSVVIRTHETPDYCMYRHLTSESMDTIFYSEDTEYVPDISDSRLQQIEPGAWMISQPNELGYIPLATIYQNDKVYNNVGSTVIQDVSQIQRSVYADMAEIYSAVTYGSHPTLVVDETTDTLNDGEVGAEPGSVIRVQSSLTGGEPNYVYEFVSPKLDAITEIRELVDHKIEKLTQVAMLRSETLIRASRSGEQIEQYDDKLSALIRKKATNLENAEAKLWKIWADWMNLDLGDEFKISYNRQYNKRSLEHELSELQSMISVYERLQEFSDGNENNVDIRNSIMNRLEQIVDSSTTNNGL